MARHTSFILGDHFQTFVEKQIDTGRYSNASEVVRAGLRLLEEHEARAAALRNGQIEAPKSPPAEPAASDTGQVTGSETIAS